MCGLGVCDGFGFCVYAEENPCLEDGCSGKSCGEDCLTGDIVGTCDVNGNCDFDFGKAISTCNGQGEMLEFYEILIIIYFTNFSKEFKGDIYRGKISYY